MAWKIVSVDSHIVDLPIRRRHRLGVGVMHRQSTVIVRVHTDDGITGLGEAVVPGGGPHWGGESVETMKAVIDRYLAPALQGVPLDGVNHACALLDRAAANNSFAKAGLEMAVFDVQGRRFGCSVADLMGGLRRDRLPVLWSVGADTPDAREEIDARLAEGHRSLKFMMADVSPREEAERVAALVHELPDDVTVGVDMNGQWSELAVNRWLPLLAASGVDIVEQPVAAANHEAMARLTARGLVVVLADESVQSPDQARRVAATRSAHAVAVKVPKSGGIVRANEVSVIARAGGLALYGGGTMETSVGTSAAAQYFGTWDGALGCDLVGPLLLTDDVVVTPVTYECGELRIPAGPGLGVELDDDKVRFYERK